MKKKEREQARGGRSLFSFSVCVEGVVGVGMWRVVDGGWVCGGWVIMFVVMAMFVVVVGIVVLVCVSFSDCIRERRCVWQCVQCVQCVSVCSVCSV